MPVLHILPGFLQGIPISFHSQDMQMILLYLNWLQIYI